MTHLFNNINFDDAFNLTDVPLWETLMVASTIPPPPEGLGEISGVLASALASVRGESNSLALTKRRMTCVVLVDGLGFENLQSRARHAPALVEQNLARSYTVFPSTTAAAIASMATGSPPAIHGLVGHVAYDQAFDETRNLLSGWSDWGEALRWKSIRDLSQDAGTLTPLFNICSPEYKETGFTALTMAEAIHVSASSIEDRTLTALEIMRDRSNAGVIYLYIQELDQCGHRHGWEGPEWVSDLERIDRSLGDFFESLPEDCGAIVTADHGQLDSPPEHRIELKNHISAPLLSVGGDSRSLYLYLEQPERKDELLKKLSVSGLPLEAFDALEFAAAGWFGGALQPVAEQRFPEILLLAADNFTLFHKDFSKSRSYLMTGHHGGISDLELSIPLIRVGF